MDTTLNKNLFLCQLDTLFIYTWDLYCVSLQYQVDTRTGLLVRHTQNLFSCQLDTLYICTWDLYCIPLQYPVDTRTDSTCAYC